MTPADWSEFVERYGALTEEWDRVRGQPDARSSCAQAQSKLIAQVATRLPARGDLVPIIATALNSAAITSAEHLLAVNALVHRYQFPRCFLPAVIAAAVRHGKDGYRIAQSAADAYGADAVVHELIAIAKTRALDGGVAEFLLYYIGESRTDVQLANELRTLTSKKRTP